jgi:ketosteroid isomerase-like protein
MIETDKRALLERLFSAFNQHDAAGVMACMTPDIVFDAAAGPDAHGLRITGTEAVSAAFTAVWTAMPDVAWTVSRHMIAGETAVTEWLFTGTRADGTRTEVQGLDLFTFRDGLIATKSAFRKDRQMPKA